MRYTLLVAALAASIATPALAQQATVTATANATAKGVVLLPLTLSETNQLDFGTVIADPTNPGTVVIDADSGGRSKTGAVVLVPNYPGGRGLFQGAGTAGNAVVLTLNAPAVLTSGANSLTVNSMSFDNGGGASTTRTIDSSGAFAIGVGGDFAIAAGQANGLYTASYTVVAEYQ